MPHKKSFLLVLIFTTAFSVAQEKAFQDGERLDYRVKYGWFNASKASLEVKLDKLDGKTVYHIKGFGKSTGLLDVFFKVRDRYESFIDTNQVKPYKFIRDIIEGGYYKNKMISFDYSQKIATVHDYKYDTVHKHQFTDKTQDMLSALYYLRNQVNNKKLKKGDEYTLNMFFDEQNFDFKTRFLGRETIETKFGKVKCLIFRPYVKSGRVFEEEESVTVWISDDMNKIPVKIEAELAVGSLTAKLNNFKGLKHPFKIMM
ncbi:DUF3108 domain-containing protein [Mesohalobacter halotolerans]|uniref:DUF3108 domain-containing protein n=1 Tax=Mesohalobacter halotolerans TaxID=1883405 RepID=A0A4U5TT32_9FLAO|nr:DUF3108 domain-containing protein [Mesohalobacter halotolerans]TKS57509.1 DUF3108 domain-containing protein [Mesohalobacter halotolerans]